MNESAIRDQLVAIGQSVQGYAGAFVNTILSSALSLVNVIILLVITPVVTIYLLLDWDRMVQAVDDLLPRDHAPVVRHLAAEIDRTLAAFLRGMGTVCLILGSYYAIALAAVGVPFGLVVGLFAGLITFIPYVGSLLGGALAIGLGLFQFWGDWVSIAIVAGIFVLGQVVEGNFLTPKLVGDSVGLHPVWLILALSVFGSLFGFIGLLVAVPVAAMIGVVARYFIASYKSGRLYQGHAGQFGQDDPDEPPAQL
jgi:predicted PurR-regulated permease PerM